MMWPNRAAPESTKSVVELIDELQRVQRKSGNGPITVHCQWVAVVVVLGEAWEYCRVVIHGSVVIS